MKAELKALNLLCNAIERSASKAKKGSKDTQNDTSKQKETRSGTQKQKGTPKQKDPQKQKGVAMKGPENRLGFPNGSSEVVSDPNCRPCDEEEGTSEESLTNVAELSRKKNKELVEGSKRTGKNVVEQSKREEKEVPECSKKRARIIEEDVPESDEEKQGKLISTQLRYNVNCRLQHYRTVVNELPVYKRSIIREMGFESLVDFGIKKIDKKFCLWLYDKFDPQRRALVFWDKVIPLTSNVVGWIMGLSTQGRCVPTHNDDLNEETKQKMEGLKGDYKYKRGFTPVILETALLTEEGERFKTVFLLYVLGYVLCPTSCSKISSDLLPAVSVAAEAKHYCWAEFVYNKLVHAATQYKKSMAQNSAGGCAIIFMILWLDNKVLPPCVAWYRKPRFLAWSQEDVDEAIENDTDEEFIDGIGYGGPHPNEGHHLPWPTTDVGAWLAMSMKEQLVNPPGTRTFHTSHVIGTFPRITDAMSGDNQQTEELDSPLSHSAG